MPLNSYSIVTFDGKGYPYDEQTQRYADCKFEDNAEFNM